MHVFVVLLLLIGSTIFPADEKVDKILQKMENRYATTEALSCRYQQTENIRQLTAEIQFPETSFHHDGNEGRREPQSVCKWREDLD